MRQKGAAYANGVVNAPKGINSLVAEEKPEILVRDGQWNLLDKPQFIDTKPGDIIIDGDKTEELLKKGYIESSGKAFNQGMGNYQSWIKVEPLEDLPLVERFKNDSALIDSVLANSSQIYMQNMERQFKGLQASLNIVQPRSVEKAPIYIDHLEFPGINDQSSVEEFTRVFRELPNAALQFSNRR